MSEILPCPFCGGEPRLVMGCPGSWYVKCTVCLVTTNDVGQDRAIAAWNTRTQAAADKATIERLTQERDEARAERDRLEQERGALAGKVEEATALIRRWVSWCDDWHAGKSHPSDDIEAARAYLAALSTTGEPKKPCKSCNDTGWVDAPDPASGRRNGEWKKMCEDCEFWGPPPPAPLTPSERARAAEDVQVARAVHGTKEPCRTCDGKGTVPPKDEYAEWEDPCPDCQGGATDEG